MAMILIHPPVAKPCEPPGGIAKLAGALEHHGVKHTVLDANLEGLLGLILGPATATDRWTVRAFRSRHQHLAALRRPSIYCTPARYRRAVSDINRLAEMASWDETLLQSELAAIQFDGVDLEAIGFKVEAVELDGGSACAG